jgi:hypothetical protein
MKINWVPKKHRWNPNAYRSDDFRNTVDFIVDFIDRYGARCASAAIRSVSAWHALNHLEMRRTIKKIYRARLRVARQRIVQERAE